MVSVALMREVEVKLVLFVPHSNHAEAKELFGLIDPRKVEALVVRPVGASVVADGGGRPAVKFWADP
jgi:hypothetical protein